MEREPPADDDGTLPAVTDGPSAGRGAAGDALAALAARIDALGAATATFRSVVGERLTDFSDQVERVQAGTARSMSDGQRAQQQAMSGIEAALAETEAGMARIDALATTLVERIDELAELTDTGPVGLIDRVGRVEAALDGFRRSTEASFADLAARLDAGPAGTDPSPESPQPATVADIDAVLDAIEALDTGLSERTAADGAPATPDDVADRLDLLADAVESLRSATAPTPAVDLGGVHARLDELAEAVGRLPSDPPPPPAPVDLSGVQARLDELADSLGAATPTADDAAVLGRLDELADAIGRLPSAPPAAPDDAAVLDRLDELADAIEARPAPDDATVLARLDELSERMDDLPVPDDSGLRDRLDALTSSLSGRVDDLADLVAGLADRPADVDGTALVARLEEVADLVAELGEREVPVTDLAPIERRLDGLLARRPPTFDTGGIERRLDELAAAAGPPDLGAVEDRLDDLTDAVGELPSVDLDPLHRKVDELTDALGELPTVDLDPLHRKVDELTDAVGELPTVDLGPLQRRLDEVAGLVRRVPTVDLGPLGERLGEVERVLDDLAADGGPDLAPLATSLDRLEAADAGRTTEVLEALGRIEGVVEALADSTGDPDTAGEIAAVRRGLEQLAGTAGSAATSDELATLRRSVEAAAGRRDERTGAALAALEETVAKLAAAQAEDLERVLDVVEEQGGKTPAVTDAMARLESALQVTDRSSDIERLEAELAALTQEVGAMRRRLTTRTKPLDDESIALLADALAVRLGLAPPARPQEQRGPVPPPPEATPSSAPRRRAPRPQ